MDASRLNIRYKKCHRSHCRKHFFGTDRLLSVIEHSIHLGILGSQVWRARKHITPDFSADMASRTGFPELVGQPPGIRRPDAEAIVATKDDVLVEWIPASFNPRLSEVVGRKRSAFLFEDLKP